MTTTNANPNDVSARRLWFGVASGAVAWSVAETFDIIVAWHTCSGGALDSNPVFTQAGLRVLLSVITFALFAITAVAGIVSYRNWRSLSEVPDFINAEGRGRKQYMAISGVVINLTLAVGIIWFAIPIYILSACVRAR